MNAPFLRPRLKAALADLADPNERRRIEAFVHAHPDATPFHLPAWLEAVEQGTRNSAIGLVLLDGTDVVGWLPLTISHSPVFGRLLASSGFAVGGGLLVEPTVFTDLAFRAVEEVAARQSCPTIELRGGLLPGPGSDWSIRDDAHCGFVASLPSSDEAQLLAIPRKQRAEVRKGLEADLTVEAGKSARDREAHYLVYAESVRNLGTPVFPRALFDAVLGRLDSDILTVRHRDKPIASVLSLYHRGAVMPYWGGGTRKARELRANDRMYFELMRHARGRGCDRFDFGRSKTGSGAYHFKRNWGFEPQPLSYAVWTAPGAPPRDANPASVANAAKAAMWRCLPLQIANRLGPVIARGLG